MSDKLSSKIYVVPASICGRKYNSSQALLQVGAKANSIERHVLSENNLHYKDIDVAHGMLEGKCKR